MKRERTYREDNGYDDDQYYDDRYDENDNYDNNKYDADDDYNDDNYDEHDEPPEKQHTDEKPQSSPPVTEQPAPEIKQQPLVYAGTFVGEYDENYQAAVLEQIRLAKARRARADKRARDKLHAEIFMITTAVIVLLILCSVIIHIGKRRREEETFVIQQPDTSSVQEELHDLPEPIEKKTAPPPVVGTTPYAGEAAGHTLIQKDGVTYVDGILLVNKTFPLPRNYAPGISQEAEQAFYAMAGDAWTNYGVGLWQNSGYRTYDEQEAKYSEYAAERGLEEADKVSARPGHSEHQTGLCYDVNSTDFSFADTFEAQWLEEHCAEYGFIVRYPKGKEKVTGYDYEPWHLRYVGVEVAQEMQSKGLCLEEYLNVTSKYENSPDNEDFLKSHEKYKDIKPDDSSAAEEQTDYGYDNGYYDYGYGY